MSPPRKRYWRAFTRRTKSSFLHFSQDSNFCLTKSTICLHANGSVYSLSLRHVACGNNSSPFQKPGNIVYVSQKHKLLLLGPCSLLQGAPIPDLLACLLVTRVPPALFRLEGNRSAQTTWILDHHLTWSWTGQGGTLLEQLFSLDLDCRNSCCVLVCFLSFTQDLSLKMKYQLCPCVDILAVPSWASRQMPCYTTKQSLSPVIPVINIRSFRKIKSSKKEREEKKDTV